MPHTDNLLGIATVASFGMLAAVVVQPWTGATAHAAGPPQNAIRVVQLPPVEVVAKRSVELARIEREDRLQCVSARAQPKA
ncbi:MAG: hypothetical protein ACM3JC_02470 [Rudaea sp.]